jgi:tetratricopeptide (TPR) repeat protein
MTDLAPPASSGAFEAGRLLCRQGHVRVALSYLRRAVEEAPDEVDRRVFFARAALQVGAATVTVEQAERVLEIDPFDVRASLLRALGLALTDNGLAALVPARVALELAPTDPETYAVLAFCLERCGRSEEAASARRRCEEMGGPARGSRSIVRLVSLPVNPVADDFWGHNEAGLKFTQQHRFRPAMRSFAMASAMRPQSGVPVSYMRECMLAYFDDVGRWISRCPPLAPFVVLFAALRVVLVFRRHTPRGFWRSLVQDSVQQFERRSVVQLAIAASSCGVAGVAGLAVDAPDSVTYLGWGCLVVMAVIGLVVLGRATCGRLDGRRGRV